MLDRVNSISWYAVSVFGQDGVYRTGEEVAERKIREEGFSTFLPMEVSAVRKYPKKRKPLKTIIRPILPGFVFVSMMKTGADWRRLKSINVVEYVVATASGPAPLTFSLLLDFQDRAQRGFLSQTTLRNRTFRASDSVRIVTGDHAGRKSCIKEVRGDMALMYMFLFGNLKLIQVPLDSLVHSR